MARNAVPRTLFTLLFHAFLLFAGLAPVVSAQNIPERLSDREFWQMIEEFSEEGGQFRSDNFVSNETSFQLVIPELKVGRAPGGVYVGVGPEQNFTYIAALQPKISFIVDIRRQNLRQHLMYKMLFEMSSNRTEFLSLLFSRKLTTSLEVDAIPRDIFDALVQTPRDLVLYEETLSAIKSRLTEDHGFALSETDLRGIDYIFSAFFNAGPNITYSFVPSVRLREGTTLRQLMTGNNGQGENESFLATEKHFQTLKGLQERNLIVPIVGDFSGPKALQMVGKYLTEHEAKVTAFYVSNVEQYLFQGTDRWSTFFKTVDALPVDSRSVFIRATFNTRGMRIGQTFARVATFLVPIQEMMKAFNAGAFQTYTDVIRFTPRPVLP